MACEVKEQLMSNVIVFGATGLLGSALVRANPGCIQVSTKDFDARDPAQTAEWFNQNKLIVTNSTAHICCGLVSGVGSQRNRVMFADNMLMAINLINNLAQHQKHGNSVYYSTSCVYPQQLDVFEEKDLFTGAFEPSNEGYALANAASTRLCQFWNRELGLRQFITIVPPNLWGQNDNWDINTCHVLPALSQRILQARAQAQSLTVWGTADTRREFLNSTDVALAAAHAVDDSEPNEVYNVGMSTDISIGEIVQGLCKRLDFTGAVEYTQDRAGNNRKLLDSTRIKQLGWQPQHSDYEHMLDCIAEEALTK